METAAEIADSLSPAQQRALLKLEGRDDTMMVLWHKKLIVLPRGKTERLPLGEDVLAELENNE